MDIKRLTEIEERCEKADKVVNELCQGTRKWVMSVPANFERDPDLVIGNSLRDCRELSHYCRSLRAEAAELARALKTNHSGACLEQDATGKPTVVTEKSCRCRGKDREIAELLSRPSIAELIGGK